MRLNIKHALLKILLTISSLVMFIVITESTLYLLDIDPQQTEMLHEFYKSGGSAEILHKIPRFQGLDKQMLTAEAMQAKDEVFRIMILGGSSVDLLKEKEDMFLEEL